MRKPVQLIANISGIKKVHKGATETRAAFDQLEFKVESMACDLYDAVVGLSDRSVQITVDVTQGELNLDD
jgi:hypothetical protein